MEDFEEILKKMTKPQLDQLKHQEMLQDAILKAKERSVISWWWIIVPVYIIAAFLMKTAFMTHSTLISNLREFTLRNKYLSILLFAVVPVVIIFVNLWSIRNIHSIPGRPKADAFLKIVWFNLLLILASILVIIVYAL